MRKYTFKDLKSNLVWTALIGLIVLGEIIAVVKKRTMPVEKCVVQVENLEGKRNLINAKEVKKIFRNYLGFEVADSEVSQLPVRELEALLLKDKRIRSVEIYLDKHNTLRVELTQRKPIVRIAGATGASYYLDQDGTKLNVKKGTAIRVPMATGNIPAYTAGFVDSKKESALRNVFLLAQKIEEDKAFLKPLVEQIHVEENNDLVLVPKVGRQKIKFGPYEAVDEKLDKLKIFYHDGLPKVGWSKYEVLRLDIKDQVRGIKKI